jgi:pimeloyl-ACP methyl ester carboxylesterase
MSNPVHVESRGSGFPLVFTHSFAGDVSHWAATLAHLEDRHRAVAFDFAGHGRSPATPGRYSIAALAAQLEAVVTQEGLDSFILVGHSLGALVAADYAGAHPDLVKALVLVDAPPAPGDIPPAQLEGMRAALDRDPYPVIEQFWNQRMFVDARPEVQTKLLESLRALPREAAAELTKVSLDYDARPALSRYGGQKFAIVTPRNDTPLSLHRAVPGFRSAIIRGTGHWIQLDAPAKFHETLDAAIRVATSETRRYRQPAAPSATADPR